MLRALNHGQVVREGGAVAAQAATSEVVSLAAVQQPAPVDRFGYLFGGGGLATDTQAFEKLGAVGAAMVEPGGIPGPSGLAAILTYFGQFIDHDITANTDRDPAALPSFSIAAAPLTINPRAKVIAQLGNLRRGTLRLDSVYGDGDRLEAKFRQGAKMRIGADTAGNRTDLPRYGPLIDEGVLTNADLPDASGMHSEFGSIDPRRLPFIGDSRNDENLIVAQLHLAFLHFHNAIAATLPGSDDARFAAAKRLVQWHYQWLVVERYLGAICEPAMLAKVIAAAAARYKAFAARTGGASADHAPLPLEFSVAAFRFGHSMIRANYVFNATFSEATLRQLFQFTGKGGMAGAPVLPDIWVIDWNNFLDSTAQGKMARPIDPLLAKGLDDLVNESKPHLNVLATRNLRRSYVLDLPTAQTVLVELRNAGESIPGLTTAELADGTGGAELVKHGYGTETPLWFYILAEARVRGEGHRLGPLGTLIVAETLLGLIILDPASYWHATGADGARWTPAAAGLPDGPIESFETMLKFAGVL